MLTFVSKKCTNLLIKKEVISLKDFALYQYGFEITISSFLVLASILLLSYLFFSPLDGIIFLVFFSPIRMYSGGYHASTYIKCYFCSIFLFLLVVIGSYALGALTLIPVIIISVLSGSYIFFTAPYAHPNNPLTRKKEEKNRKKSRFMVFLDILLIFILFFLQKHFSILALYTLALVAAMIYIPKNILDKRRDTLC